MMEDSHLIIDILRDIALPAFTAVAGWFASVWRTKQKKEKDVLENVSQILALQKKYIAEQDEENKRTRDINKRLEAKLDDKNRSIRKANYCKYTSQENGCPVLNQEEAYDGNKCETCKYNKELTGDNGKD